MPSTQKIKSNLSKSKINSTGGRQTCVKHHDTHSPAFQHTAHSTQTMDSHLLTAMPHSMDGECHPVSTLPACSGSHHNVQVSQCGGQMEEKEEKRSLRLMKRDGTEKLRVEGSSLL